MNLISNQLVFIEPNGSSHFAVVAEWQPSQHTLYAYVAGLRLKDSQRVEVDNELHPDRISVLLYDPEHHLALVGGRWTSLPQIHRDLTPEAYIDDECPAED
jgi:hypothetical protein